MDDWKVQEDPITKSDFYDFRSEILREISDFQIIVLRKISEQLKISFSGVTFTKFWYSFLEFFIRCIVAIPFSFLIQREWSEVLTRWNGNQTPMPLWIAFVLAIFPFQLGGIIIGTSVIYWLLQYNQLIY